MTAHVGAFISRDLQDVRTVDRSKLKRFANVDNSIDNVMTEKKRKRRKQDRGRRNVSKFAQLEFDAISVNVDESIFVSRSEAKCC